MGGSAGAAAPPTTVPRESGRHPGVLSAGARRRGGKGLGRRVRPRDLVVSNPLAAAAARLGGPAWLPDPAAAGDPSARAPAIRPMRGTGRRRADRRGRCLFRRLGGACPDIRRVRLARCALARGPPAPACRPPAGRRASAATIRSRPGPGGEASTRWPDRNDDRLLLPPRGQCSPWPGAHDRPPAHRPPRRSAAPRQNPDGGKAGLVALRAAPWVFTLCPPGSL